MNLTVIIVTFNGANWIERCLNSLFQSSVLPKIIIVDSHSTDDTLHIVENYSEVHLIRLPSNFGFGKANNIGISYAINNGAEYLFLLNQDTYVEKHMFKKLLFEYDNNESLGILSPIHLTGNGEALDSNFANYLVENKKIIFDALIGELKMEFYELPFVNAAGWLIHKNVFYKIGGFDPLFFHYGEDVNYCQRLNYHELKIGILTGAYLFHDRENRVDKPDNLDFFEKKIKVRWGDINKKNLNETGSFKRKLYKLLLVNVLSFNFSRSRIILRQIKILNRCLPLILSSRNINKRSGHHYLKFDVASDNIFI